MSDAYNSTGFGIGFLSRVLHCVLALQLQYCTKLYQKLITLTNWNISIWRICGLYQVEVIQKTIFPIHDLDTELDPGVIVIFQYILTDLAFIWVQNVTFQGDKMA
jgi:hypothetical protein